MSPSQVVVTLSDVTVSYGERTILDNISLTIQQDEFVYLVGSTGSGKSTLLRLIYADQQPNVGSLQVERFDLSTLTRKEVPFLRRRLGIVFQDYQLLPDRDVASNIRFALQATGWKNSRQIKQRITEVLLQVGMSGRAQAMPHQLSGGEQQRVAIARALINAPAVIVADEPTGNLDPHAAQYIMEILRKIHFQGTTVLMATHEYDLIHDYPGRVLELVDGQVVDYEESATFLAAYRRRLR